MFKLIFKKNSCGNSCTKGFPSLLNQFLAFVRCFVNSSKIFSGSVVASKKPFNWKKKATPAPSKLFISNCVISISFKL